MSERGARGRWVGQAVVVLLCAVPMAVIWYQVLAGNVRGEWIKTVTHQTGRWGLGFIAATLAVTPLRRITGWNLVAPYRRTLGLVGFSYIVVHFLIYLVLDQFFDIGTIAKDVGKRPYITLGFTGFVLMVPLAVTSTKGWIRRLGRRWTRLHALIYVTALVGVVHFTWAVKKDLAAPTFFAAVIGGLLVLRLVPVAWLRPWRNRALSRM